MIDAVIVSTARTGLGKSWKGAFNMTYGAALVVVCAGVVVVVAVGAEEVVVGADDGARCSGRELRVKTRTSSRRGLDHISR